MASFSTFADPMTASTQNTALWGGNFGTLSWSGGGFTITNPSAYTGYGGDSTVNAYDLTGASCFCSVANVGSQSLTSCESIPLQLDQGSNVNRMFFYINGGNLSVIKSVTSTNTTLATVTYSAASHKWFRMRESGGTTFFDTSADGITWNNMTSTLNPITVTALHVSPSLGTFNSEASSTTMKLNSFNTAPLSGHLLSMMGMGS